MNDLGQTREELLAGAAALLRGAGIPDPRREARRIWADVAELAGSAFAPGQSDRPDRELPGRFQAAVARRVRGEPLAYATGVAGFRRLTLRVDRRGLIPRPETEGLVELVLARTPAGRVADVGTGSGCIALALADEGRYDLILALDRSGEALSLAAENRSRTGLSVALLRGHLTEPLASDSLDALVSNPPYLSEAEYAALEPGVRDFEPAAALVSGPDGLGATAALLADGRRVVRPGGLLALEVDTTRAATVAGMAGALGWAAVAVQDDLFGRARYVLARRSDTA